MYKEAIIDKVIKDFVLSNQRTPTEEELADLILEPTYKSVPEIGFTSVVSTRPQWQEESSVAKENANREAMFSDMVEIDRVINELTTNLQITHRAAMAASNRLSRKLQAQEARVDNLLLLNNRADIFVHGIEETFDTCEKVQDATTALVQAGFVTQAQTEQTMVSLSDALITINVIGDGILNSGASSSIDTIKELDGMTWDYYVHTQQAVGRITLVIDIDFKAPTDLSYVLLEGLAVSVQSPTSLSLYTIEDSVLNPVYPLERQLMNSQSLQIGKTVKKLRLQLSKTAADSKTVSNAQYIYAFSIDAIRCFTSGYSGESILYAGPYSIRHNNADSYFTKARLDPCTIEPEGTSIDWALSKDGTTYTTVSNASGLAIYNTLDGSGEQTLEIPDLNIDPRSFTTIAGLNVSFQTEAVLNTALSEPDLVPLQSLIVRRNVPSLDVNVLGQPSGWFYDGLYKTTLIVPVGGRWLDLGPTEAVINNVLCTGRVYLPEGYSTFHTSPKYFKHVSSNLTEEALRLEDSLYPYNHKLLVEGYASSIYTGFTYFGKLLNYVSPNLFRNSTSLDHFTVLKLNGIGYIVLKVRKEDASYINELTEVEWTTQAGNTNQLYVRAILVSNSPLISPVIESFAIRVI